MVDLGVTLDHRLVDGAQLGPAIAAIRHVVEHPTEALGPIQSGVHPLTAEPGHTP